MVRRLRDARAKVIAATAALVLGIAAALAPLAARAATDSPWLFVSDIHLDPLARYPEPSDLGKDTNPALLDSAIAAMRRAVPDPPVVFIPGDFFSHGFQYTRADSTMRAIARTFDRAFPHAQFVIALGNEDSACADYTLAANAPFLRATAAAWAPLVNRRGAAPEFARSFPHTGTYTARLPRPGLRAVVVDDVFWSTRYRAGCGPSGDSAAAALADLDRALRPRAGEKRWLVLHIPPGVDAYSTTHLVHHLVVVPFLETGPRERLNDLIAEPARDVTLVIAGHTHKLAYRIGGERTERVVPMLLLPGLSPILRNAPGFVTAHVGGDGTLEHVRSYAFLGERWTDLGGFDALGVPRFTAPALEGLQQRLDRNAGLRATFASLYNGGTRPEINDRNWRSYWCAATALRATDFRACVGESGFSALTGRGIVAIVAAILGLAVFATLAVRRRRRRTAR